MWLLTPPLEHTAQDCEVGQLRVGRLAHWGAA